MSTLPPTSSPQARQGSSTPVRRTPTLPLGVIFLAIVGIGGGGLGVSCGLPSLFSSADERGIQEMLDELAELGTPEYKQLSESLRSDPEMLERLENTVAATHNIIPGRKLFEFLNILLSALSLAAGVGLMMRKEWGRKMEIWFIVAATALVFGWGYLMIPGIVNLFDVVSVQFEVQIVEEGIAGTLYLWWSVMAIVFGLLHAGIVLYLMRPNVKAAFVPIPAEPPENA